MLLYGCEIWGFSELTEVDVFHRLFLRKVLAVGKATKNVFVYGETGCTDLKGMITKRMVSFWFSLIHGKQSKISALLYKLVVRKHLDERSPFNSKWFQGIKDSLEELGLAHVWHDEGRGYDPGKVLRSIQVRSDVLFDARWCRERDEDRHGSFELYRLFKPVRFLSPYLVELRYSERRALSRFFCRSNFLPCSDFRLIRNDPLFDPTCLVCQNEIGDELHYIFRCPNFARVRARLLDFSERVGSEEEKLVSLLQTDSLAELSHLAKFLRVVLKVCERCRELEMQAVQ